MHVKISQKPNIEVQSQKGKSHVRGSHGATTRQLNLVFTLIPRGWYMKMFIAFLPKDASLSSL